MIFLSMSISASLMIITIIALRKIFLNKIPSIIWGIMWVFVAIKLLIPYHFSTDYNIYNGIYYLLNYLHVFVGSHKFFGLSSIVQLFYNKVFLSIIISIWIIGIIYVSKGFLRDFITTMRMKKTATVIGNATEIYKLLQSYGLSQKYTLCELENITSPVACGVVKPMIIFPKNFMYTSSDIFIPALLHEYMHLKYRHPLYQYFLICIVILNWFNPFIWIFYQYVNRDMEIACDRGVLKYLGEDYSEVYSLKLVKLIEKNRKEYHNQLVFYNSFSKNILKERIVSIMRFKKFSTTAIAISTLLPLSIISTFGPNSNYVFGAEIVSEQYPLEIVAQHPMELETDISSPIILLTWEQLTPYVTEYESRAASSIKVVDYIITHNSISEFQDKITVTLQKEGYTYKGTLSLTNVKKSGTKYIGYYSGTLYR